MGFLKLFGPATVDQIGACIIVVLVLCTCLRIASSLSLLIVCLSIASGNYWPASSSYQPVQSIIGAFTACFIASDEDVVVVAAVKPARCWTGSCGMAAKKTGEVVLVL